MPRALSGCSFIIVHKTPNKNRRQADHSLETCLCNNRVLVASLSIQNKVKKKSKHHIFTAMSLQLCTYTQEDHTDCTRSYLCCLQGIAEGMVTSSQLRGSTGDKHCSLTQQIATCLVSTQSVSKAVLYGLAPYLALASPFLSAERDCK